MEDKKQHEEKQEEEQNRKSGIEPPEEKPDFTEGETLIPMKKEHK